ncbi:MAG: FAD-dependent oxidoreductase [Zavarzinia sp.]|nr:FAD-dependent oxidoreductase [Zavarzinia sp.]
MTRDVVIIGAGQAGGRAAEALRKVGFDAPVFLVGEEDRPPYERPPLSKSVLTGKSDAGAAALFGPEFYDENRIELVIGTRVTRIDPAARKVELAGRAALSYGHLLICTGGRVRELDFADRRLSGLHYLRTAADAEALRDSMARAGRMVVVGGGFLGLEVAASARAFGIEVTVIEGAPHLLDRVLPPAIAERIAALHVRQGVTLRLGCPVVGIRAEGGAVTSVETADGRSVPADVVVVAAGIVPNVELAADAGLQIGNGVVVDEFCRTAAPGILAAGDVANHPNALLGRRLRLESWQNAQNQAIAAAKTIGGQGAPYAEIPWFWSDQYDMNIQVVSVPPATDATVLRGDPESGHFTCLSLFEGAVVGATAFNMGKEVRAARMLIEHRLHVAPAELADTSVRLRDIAEKHLAAVPADRASEMIR